MFSYQPHPTLSSYRDLYDILIPKDHLLRRMHDEIDYSFIYEEVRNNYSPNMGRASYDPILLFKCLVLKTISDLSDEDLIEEVRMNMAYKYFLDLAPEDMPPCPATLCVFRRQRLKDRNLMDLLLGMTVGLAEEKGILKRDASDGKIHVKVIIDGTHSVSPANIYRPVPTLKEYSKRLRAQVYRCDESQKGLVETDHNVSSTDLEGEIAYGHRLAAYVREKLPHMLDISSLKRALNRFEELLADIANHYTASAADPDARVGHKTADTEFFGYKSQIGMDEDTRLILGAEVTSGEIGDAVPGQEVISGIAENPSLRIEEVLGDTSYSGQPFLALAEKNQFRLIAPPHPNLGNGIDGRNGFTFNKDADMFVCPNGHLAEKKRTVTYKKDNGRKATIYTFSKEKYAACPMRERCLGNSKSGSKTYSVTQLTPEQKRLLREKETEYFKRRRRERYKIEAKNAHLKQGYGFDKAKGKGIEMMELQAAVTFFVSNLKIIFAKK